MSPFGFYIFIFFLSLVIETGTKYTYLSLLILSMLCQIHNFVIYVFSENTFLISIAIIIKCFIINLMLILLVFKVPFPFICFFLIMRKVLLFQCEQTCTYSILHTEVNIVIFTTGMISIPDIDPSIYKFDYVHHLGHSRWMIEDLLMSFFVLEAFKLSGNAGSCKERNSIFDLLI